MQRGDEDMSGAAASSSDGGTSHVFDIRSYFEGQDSPRKRRRESPPAEVEANEAVSMGVDQQRKKAKTVWFPIFGEMFGWNPKASVAGRANGAGAEVAKQVNVEGVVAEKATATPAAAVKKTAAVEGAAAKKEATEKEATEKADEVDNCRDEHRCLICHEPLSSACRGVRGPCRWGSAHQCCGATFHTQCLQRWTMKNKSCPSCRVVIPSASVFLSSDDACDFAGMGVRGASAVLAAVDENADHGEMKARRTPRSPITKTRNGARTSGLSMAVPTGWRVPVEPMSAPHTAAPPAVAAPPAGAAAAAAAAPAPPAAAPPTVIDAVHAPTSTMGTEGQEQVC